MIVQAYMCVTPQPGVFAIPQQASGIILLCIIVWFPGVVFKHSPQNFNRGIGRAKNLTLACFIHSKIRFCAFDIIPVSSILLLI